MPKTIAVTGYAGAGKSTAIAYLESIGFGRRLYVGQIVIDEVTARGLPATPESELLVRTALRHEFGPLVFADRACEKITAMLNAGTNVLLDAVLLPAELEHYLVNIPPVCESLAVCASFEVRATRLSVRDKRSYNRQQLVERDEIEKTALRTDLVIASADVRIDNEGALSELYSELRQKITS